ncbi:Uncharacterised protein [Dorea longicatena]|nr:Uncharacterised protein [Dorea longicatena]
MLFEEFENVYKKKALIFIYSVVMAEKKKICCTIRESIRFFHY